jgi:hypothetical protein
MLNRHSLLLGIASLLLAAGCTNPDFGVPRICDPVPESAKVARARKFDPYPDPSIGPAVVGGRPIDYINPRPEPDITKNTRFLSGAGAAYPPATGYAPPAVYPPVSSAPLPYSAPPAVYPPPVANSAPANLVPIVDSGATEAAPVAYGKALGSP